MTSPEHTKALLEQATKHEVVLARLQARVAMVRPLSTGRAADLLDQILHTLDREVREAKAARAELWRADRTQHVAPEVAQTSAELADSLADDRAEPPVAQLTLIAGGKS